MSCKVFISYSHEDKALRRQLEQHLQPLVRQGLIQPWSDRRITAGTEWAGKIDKHLKNADIVLLLVSASFVASDYCFDRELRHALERHESGKARVIPIIIRPCDWQQTPFSKLQALPRDAKPVTASDLADQAWTDVVKGIRAAVAELPARRRVVTQKVIGVDVGASNIAAGILDLSWSTDELTGFQSARTDIVRPVTVDGLLQQVGDLVDGLLKAQGLDSGDVAGVGIAAPGQVKRKTGQLRYGPNLRVRGVGFKRPLQLRFGRDLKVRVDNDARCATRCELHYGAFGQDPDYKNFTCIFIGTGMGSGLVIDRRIYYGKGCAGEIGHTVLTLGDPDPPQCNCGRQGCLEAYVNGPGISRLARRVAKEWQQQGRATCLQDHGDDIRPEDVVRCLKQQDEGAEEVTRAVARYLGHGLSNYYNIVEPDAIVLGGGMMAGFFDFLIDDMQTTMDERCGLHLSKPEIFQAEFMNDGAVIGAALLFHPDEDWSTPE